MENGYLCFGWGGVKGIISIEFCKSFHVCVKRVLNEIKDNELYSESWVVYIIYESPCLVEFGLVFV